MLGAPSCQCDHHLNLKAEGSPGLGPLPKLKSWLKQTHHVPGRHPCAGAAQPHGRPRLVVAAHVVAEALAPLQPPAHEPELRRRRVHLVIGALSGLKAGGFHAGPWTSLYPICTRSIRTDVQVKGSLSVEQQCVCGDSGMVWLRLRQQWATAVDATVKRPRVAHQKRRIV